MSTKKTVIKNFIQWILAIAIAFLATNLLIFPYWYAPGWISTPYGATDAFYHPGTMVINGYEGYGYASVDQNGYLNESLPLAEGHVLAIGCSHTKAVEVPMSQRYTSILNEKLSGGDNDRLYVYNLSIDGLYFTQMLQGFSAALQQFPDTGAVVMEIPTTIYTPKALETMSLQRLYFPEYTGQSIYRQLGSAKKLEIALKEKLPLVSLYFSKQFVSEEDTKIPFLYKADEEKQTEPYPYTKEEYQKGLETAFFSLRFYWDGPLIIYYHPETVLMEDGTLGFEEHVTTSWFAEMCSQYDIQFVDATEAFAEAYEEDYTVPYGFANSAPATGHMNKAGHRISAELIYRALKGGTTE